MFGRSRRAQVPALDEPVVTSVKVVEQRQLVTRVLRWAEDWTYLSAVEAPESEPLVAHFHDVLMLDPRLARVPLRRGQVAIRAVDGDRVGPWVVLGPYTVQILEQLLDDGTVDRKQAGLLRDLPEEGGPGARPCPGTTHAGSPSTDSSAPPPQESSAANRTARAPAAGARVPRTGQNMSSSRATTRHSMRAPPGGQLLPDYDEAGLVQSAESSATNDPQNHATQRCDSPPSGGSTPNSAR